MKIEGWNKTGRLRVLWGTFSVNNIFHITSGFRAIWPTSWRKKSIFTKIKIFHFLRLKWMSTILLSTKYRIFVCTLIFKVTVGSKVKMVKTGSRIILKVFNLDSYSFWVTESKYDLSFALGLIFKVTARSKFKKIKTGSW